MAEVKATKDTFDGIVSKGTVLVDFWATWCGPCRMMGQIIEKAADKLYGVTVAKVNVDEEPELADRYEVTAIPTLLLFKDGILADKNVGAMPEEDLLKFIGK